MHFDIIETERLLLRKFTPEDYIHLFEKEKEEDTREILGNNYDKIYERYKAGLKSFNRSFVHFQLINKANNEIVGGCGYHTWCTDQNRAEIGYSMDEKSLRGKGLMKEALLPIIKYGFLQMHLHRIEACTGVDNRASQRLLKYIGFKKEAVLREHYLNGEGYVDSIMYAILEHEFDQGL